MKKILILLSIISFYALSTIGQTTDSQTGKKKVNKNAPYMEFEKVVHDYGALEYRADGTCEFRFKNTGKEPLIITKCKSSCGCTVPSWPREPIAKKKGGVIKVKYATNRPGIISKSVTITSNASNSPIVLKIKGRVKPKPPVQQTTPMKEGKSLLEIN